MKASQFILLFSLGLTYQASAQIKVSTQLSHFHDGNLEWQLMHSGSQLITKGPNCRVIIRSDQPKVFIDSGDLTLIKGPLIAKSKLWRKPGTYSSPEVTSKILPRCLERMDYGCFEGLNLVYANLMGPLVVTNRPGDTLGVYHYSKGKKHGVCTDYQTVSKVIEYEEEYREGKKHGRSYTSNTETGGWKEEWYDDDELKLLQAYDSEGQLRRLLVPNVVRSVFYSDGKIYSTRYKLGWNFGYERYDTNGVLRVKGRYVEFEGQDTIGVWTTYDSSGNIVSQKEYDRLYAQELEEEINEIFENFAVLSYPELHGGDQLLQEKINEKFKPRRWHNGSITYDVEILKDGRIGTIKLVQLTGRYFEKNEALFKEHMKSKTHYKPMSRFRPVVSTLRIEMLLD